MAVLDIKISHQTVDSFVGQFAWPTLILAGFVVLIYTFVTVLVLTEQIPLVGGVLVASGLYYMVYTVFHEAAHGNISGDNEAAAWMNEALGYVMAQILCVSYCAHKKQHLKNHTHRNEPLSTNQLNFFQEIALVVRLQYQNFFTDNWAYSSVKDRRKVIVEITLMFVGRGILIFNFGALNTTLFFAASLLLGVVILVILFIWCVHPTNSKQNQYQNTITVLFPKSVHWLITRLWLFQNYHIIHHLFPRVPFYKYQDLFHEIEVTLIEKNASIVRL